MVAAETMTGANGRTVRALPHAELQGSCRKYGRLTGSDTLAEAGG